MKVKCFNTLASCIEKEINEWMDENNINDHQIINTTQSATTSSGTTFVQVIIWYTKYNPDSEQN